jgi:hypothetical protein
MGLQLAGVPLAGSGVQAAMSAMTATAAQHKKTDLNLA